MNNKANNPTIINPIYHNHGVATTETYNAHNNNPREIIEYEDSDEDEEDQTDERTRLEPVQSTNKGKVV